MLDAPTRWGLQIERSGQWLVRAVELAIDSATRRKGLLGRERLAPDTGLVIAPSQGVHTFGMRFPIDIVGIARDGRVVKMRRGVRPGRLVFALRAFAILELAAGVSLHAGLAIGDRLVAARCREHTFVGGAAS